MLKVATAVLPDDLARVIDALQKRAAVNAADGQRMVEGSVGAIAVEEAVRGETGVLVNPDDLAQVVDGTRTVADDRQRRGKGDVSASAFEKAVEPEVVTLERPDDLIRIIDAECLGGAAPVERIVECVVGVD